jgi:DNA mismatch endonuclease (patch repair protein)
LTSDSPGPRRTTAVMRGNTRRDTLPELRIRRLLHAAGLRYRVDHPIRFPSGLIRPDIVFVGPRLAVFVDGCFWHGCPSHFVPSKSNVTYWTMKITKNRERDAKQTTQLTDAGWQVMRLWSHISPDKALSLIVEALGDRARLGVRGAGPIDRSQSLGGSGLRFGR